jgi:hypothetical protein
MVFDANVTITLILALKCCILNFSCLCKDNNGNNCSNNNNNNFTYSYNNLTHIYLSSFKRITAPYETGTTTQI